MIKTAHKTPSSALAPVSCFAPVSGPQAKALILGTMPGGASLAAEQYYAHPRNHFWRIMGELIGADPSLPYDQRLAALSKNHIALWDVLENCVRPGSLDSNISAEVPNDFQSFFAARPEITHIFFNGAPAAKFFKKFVLKNIDGEKFIFTTLPSTSPANASWSYERKLGAWKKIFNRSTMTV